LKIFHYQKIDKYKRKYRGNIFVSKFLRDFTDGNIPLVYTDGITVGKKFKTKQKKKDDVSFLPTKLPTEFTVGKFRRYTVNTVHHVNYKGNHRRNFLSVFFRECYLAVFWKNSINLKFSFKYYRRNHRRIEKPSVIVGGFWKKFTKLKI